MAHRRRSPAPVDTPAAGQGVTSSTHNTPHAARSQRLRHFNQPLADVLVQVAIQSGHLERLKAAIQEGQFDG